MSDEAIIVGSRVVIKDSVRLAPYSTSFLLSLIGKKATVVDMWNTELLLCCDENVNSTADFSSYGILSGYAVIIECFYVNVINEINDPENLLTPEIKESLKELFKIMDKRIKSFKNIKKT